MPRPAPATATITRWLAALAAALLLASLAGQFMRIETGHDHVKGLVPLFNVDAEENLPSFFSVLLLLGAAALLAREAWHASPLGRRTWWPWALLAAGFTWMAYDEAFSVHERLILPMRALLDGESRGIFYYGWVAPGLVLVAAVGVVLLPFLRRLPGLTRRRFLLAGGIYLVGALGVEMLGGLRAARHGTLDWPYALIVTTEEGLEMAGLIVFIRALLLHRRPEVVAA